MTHTPHMRLVLQILLDHGDEAERVRLAAAAALGLSSTRYYQLVNALVDDYEARALGLAVLDEYADRRARRRAMRQRRALATDRPAAGEADCE